MKLRTLLLCALVANAAVRAETRAQAVFVLSEDVVGRAPFAAPAKQYFAARVDPERDLLVTSARSLQEVREWLARSPQRRGQPWGAITLVAHGSPWVGIAVPLFLPDAPSDRSALEHAIASGAFPPLGNEIVDAKTVVRVDSCGVGKRPDLLRLYAELLGGRDAPPTVEGSAQWIEFGSTLRNSRVTRSWREERPFVSELIPGARVDSKRERRVRERLDTELASTLQTAGRTPPASWRLEPVRIETHIVDGSLCDRLSPQVLAGHAPVQRRLRDHGMRPGGLKWRVDRVDDRCALIGEATLATLGAGAWPANALP